MQIKSKSIKTRFFFVFISISVIPIFIVTIISYNSYTSLTSKQINLVSSNTLSNSVERINNVFQDINRITETLVYQQYSAVTNALPSQDTVATELKKYLYSTEVDQYELFQTRKSLMFLCQNVMYNYNYINGVYIFMPNGSYVSYGRGTDLKLDYKPFDDKWYKKTIEKNGQLYIGDVNVKDFIYNARNSIAFSRALYDVDTREFLGVLMLDCSLDIFAGLDNVIIPDITNIYLINGKGEILFDDTKDKIGRYLSSDFLEKVLDVNEGSFTSDTGDLLTVFKSFPSNNWKLVAFISINELNREFAATGKLIIFIAGTCAIIIILLSLVLSALLTKPITELSETMRRNKSHVLITAKKNLERSDEIGVLYTEYNDMITEINTYIKESYQNRLISLDSQMKALEAQINSHFLYNTLASIYSIAVFAEVDSIAKISKALGDMFRYSIKTKSELVTVEEELSHVNNYLTIQKICYEDKINFILDIQDNLYTAQILKLILQPIVENAIYHGLENKNGKGSITIKGYSIQNKIYFEIIDDGIGISSEQMQEIKNLLNEPPQFTELGQRNKRSIGIKNVHSRIELYYGSGYGLTIESKKDLGTKVKICVPLTI